MGIGRAARLRVPLLLAALAGCGPQPEILVTATRTREGGGDLTVLACGPRLEFAACAAKPGAHSIQILADRDGRERATLGIYRKDDTPTVRVYLYYVNADRTDSRCTGLDVDVAAGATVDVGVPVPDVATATCEPTSSCRRSACAPN